MVMTTRRSLAMFFLLLTLTACDGHFVALDIREQQTAHQKASHRTLYGCGGTNIVDVVGAVADSLHLVQRPASTSVAPRSQYEWSSPDGRFMLSLENQSGGLWRAVLADWPESSRSALSSQAEAKIRQSLKASCPPN